MSRGACWFKIGFTLLAMFEGVLKCFVCKVAFLQNAMFKSKVGHTVLGSSELPSRVKAQYYQSHNSQRREFW